jgi:hypothetical protein
MMDIEQNGGMNYGGMVERTTAKRNGEMDCNRIKQRNELQLRQTALVNAL